jgi:ATP-dependent DNA helicase RecG
MDNTINDFLKKPIRHIKSIGEVRARLFHRLNIFTVDDLITHFPREYEDRGNLKKISQLVDGETCAFEGIIMSKVNETRIRKGMMIYNVHIKDETGSIVGTWFNQHFIKNVFYIGESYVFYGKISKKFRNFEVQSPVYEKIDDKEMKKTCRIVPVYPSTYNLTQNMIVTAISNALKSVVGSIDEILPLWVLSNYHLSEINHSMQNIHFPSSEKDFNSARFRLVFEELFMLQLGLLSIKNNLEGDKKGIKFEAVSEIEAFITGLSFKLTNAQSKVFKEIKKDMESGKVMNRLVQGDVGSGKTIVAVLALFKAVRSGYQGAMMVPTEILAQQHFESISSLLSKYEIKIALLKGSQTKKQKSEILDNIKAGGVDIVIGTHALLEENVEFERLGLVITDEQHRFGVRQRAVLSRKGNNPDVLVMTATPIPRTLALILYGDLDISIIDELPPGRKPVETYPVDESMRERINSFIRKKVQEGRQVYIVCPLVDESDSIEAKSATNLAEKISQKDFSDLKVGLIHGKLKSREKEEIMKSFAVGNLDILVSTTVIEVGVNVPNATVMAVENAERFGLAQLHQLRGRVGRGESQSYCILYNEGKSDVSKERMKVMQKTNDGFVISEKDLELRGPGEFFGTRQHGIPDLKIANLYKDMDILRMSQEAALKILSEDKKLEKPEHTKLREIISEKFKSKMDMLSLN